MKRFLNSLKGKMIAALGAGVVALPASAAIDVSTATAAVTAAEANIESIALALIGLAVVAMVGRWLKAQFF